MLRSMTLAAAAIVLASPAIAEETCLTDALGAQCDMFLDEYRADEVPVGTPHLWPTREFLLERYHDFRPRSVIESPAGGDVLYWDGDSAMIVPEETGPRLEIADW